MELLATTSLSNVEISRLTGFSDYNHFTRVFRRQTGLTPAPLPYLYGSRYPAARIGTSVLKTGFCSKMPGCTLQPGVYNGGTRSVHPP